MTAVRTFPDESSMSHILRPMRLGWLKVESQRSNSTSFNSWPKQSQGSLGHSQPKCGFRHPWLTSLRARQVTLTTAGGFHDPFKIVGEVSLGQYIRSIGRNSPFGAGNQLASL